MFLISLTQFVFVENSRNSFQIILRNFIRQFAYIFNFQTKKCRKTDIFFEFLQVTKGGPLVQVRKIRHFFPKIPRKNVECRVKMPPLRWRFAA